jgi:predicted transcriptional regulator
MSPSVAPIKVDAETDRVISHAAHFLQRSKKDFVDAAVREYIENHRNEIEDGVRESIRSLNGTTESAVALLTGLSQEDLDELGGFQK